MSDSHAQDTLLAHLTDPDSLDYLLSEGFGREVSRAVLPTEAARKVTGWCIDYYFDNQRAVAPSKDAILEAWGDELERVELVINDEFEPDSIQGAVAQLRATYSEYMTQQIVREVAREARDADVTGKLTVVQDASWRFYELNQALASRRHHGVGAQLYEDALDRYVERRDNDKVTQGLTFGTGMEQLDNHMHGLHPGELGIIAGGSGVGKSFVAARATLGMWRQNKKVVYFTLENDTPMTGDRLLCMHTGSSYSRFQDGNLDEDEIERMLLATEQMQKSEKPFEVIMPNQGDRTVLDMYRQALVLGAEGMIIDQLTFVDHSSTRREEHQQIADTMHQTKALINEGSEQIWCLMLHQVNRQGVEFARKNGRYEKDHMKGGQEIENTADYLACLYQSPDQRIAEELEWQELKFRRGVPVDWEMRWRLGYGDIAVRRQVVPT